MSFAVSVSCEVLAKAFFGKSMPSLAQDFLEQRHRLAR